MSHDPDREFSILDCDPVVSGEVPKPPQYAIELSSKLDALTHAHQANLETQLEIYSSVTRMRSEFAELRLVVEKHEPMPRSMRVAAWVIAAAMALMALHRVAFEQPAVPVRAAQLPLSAMSVPP